MKKLTKFFVLLFVSFVLIAQLSGCQSSGGNPLASDNFVISNYDTKIVVESNRVLQIEENITVLYKYANISVGIIRDIPRLKELNRNGVNHRFIYDVSNISVKTNGNTEYFFTEYYGYNEPKEYFSIYVGRDGDYKLPATPYTYTIKYTYKIGDEVEGYEWFDYAIIDSWSVPIYSASFEVTMPHAFDHDNVIMFVGGHHDFKPTFNGNTLSGSFTNTEPAVANAFYAECHFFVGADYFDKASIPLSTALLVCYYIFFALIGLCVAAIIYILIVNSRKAKKLEPCEYPPKNITPMEAYGALKLNVTTKQLIPMILYWQERGLVSVKMEGKHLCLTKLKDGDKFMNSFFKNNKFSTADITPLKGKDAKEFFGNDYENYTPTQRLMLIEQENDARKNRAEKIHSEFDNYRKKICDNQTGAKTKIIATGAVLSIATVVLMLIWVCIVQRSFLPMFFAIFVIAGTMVSMMSHTMGYKSAFFNPLIIFFISFNAMPLAFVAFAFLPPLQIAWIMYFTSIAVLVSFYILRGFINSRSQENLELCAQILAFKRFLEEADDARLQRIELKKKGYYNQILPYLFLFNMTNKINESDGLDGSELNALIRGMREFNYYYYPFSYIRSYRVYHSSGWSSSSGGSFGGGSGGSSGGHGGGGGRGR